MDADINVPREASNRYTVDVIEPDVPRLGARDEKFQMLR